MRTGVGDDLPETDGGLRSRVVGRLVRDPAQDHCRGDRLISSEHVVEQVDADEVREPGHRQRGQFPRGARHVQGGADTGARLVEQCQPLPGSVLLAGVERHGTDAAHLAADLIPHRPHLDDGRTATVGGRLVRADLVPHRHPQLGHFTDAPAQLRADAALRGAPFLGRGPIQPRVTQLPVEHGHGDRGLCEGPVQHRRPVVRGSVGARYGGHQIFRRSAAGVRPPADGQREIDAVAVAVTKGRGTAPLPRTGDERTRRLREGGLGEQIGRGVPHDLRGRIAEQPPGAFAPARDDPPGAENGGPRVAWTRLVTSGSPPLGPFASHGHSRSSRPAEKSLWNIL